MKLVVDTNILVSFFRENPVKSIIVSSKSFELELFTPEYALGELRANKPDIFKYSKLETDEEFEFTIGALGLFVETKPMSFFKEFEPDATEISPDPKDIPFFALALKLGSSIWSNEPRLQKQPSITVFSTAELRKLLGI